MDRYLTVEEAADLVRLKPSSIRRWIRTGRLKAVKTGKGYLIDPEELQQAYSAEISLLEEPDLEGAKLEESALKAIQTLTKELDPNAFNDRVKEALETLKGTISN